MLFDNKHRQLHDVIASKGSVTASIVHNHPSGDPTPSKEDIEMTRRLREVGEVIGVRVLDHVVIGKGRYCSFVDDGYW